MLTLPGYCVIERKLGSVRVVNPKGLPDVIYSRGTILGDGDIDVIKPQLEEKCRDVAFLSFPAIIN